MKKEMKKSHFRDRTNLSPFFGKHDNGPILQKLDRLFDSVMEDDRSPFNSFTSPDKFSPAVEVLERRESLLYFIDLPGVRREEIEVEVKGNKLVVLGNRRPEPPSPEDTGHYVERRFGHFSRSFTLPENADLERIEGEYHDGVLKITIAKSELQRSLKIRIQDRTAS